MTYTEYIENIILTYPYKPRDYMALRNLEIEFAEKFPGHYDISFEDIDGNGKIALNIIFYAIEEKVEWMLRYG